MGLGSAVLYFIWNLRGKQRKYKFKFKIKFKFKFKMKSILVVAGMTLIISASFIKAPKEQRESLTQLNEAQKKSPIEGNWELVSTLYNGTLTTPKRSPSQFKMFHDGYCSFLMYDDAGNFAMAGAGTYKIDGNQYQETLTYCNEPAWIGMTDWQEWEMKGDTLIFSGFKKVTKADGTDVTKDWGGDCFVEKRVRAKK